MRPNPRNYTSQLTASSVSEFSTKQLSKRTWSDFERLFETHPAPGAYPCWCIYNHRSGGEKKTPVSSGSGVTTTTRENLWSKDVHTESLSTRMERLSVGANMG